MTASTVLEVNYEDIKFEEKEGSKVILGTGSYGAVFLARWSDRQIAAKKLYPTTNTSASTREINQLYRINHKNIVKLYGISKYDNYTYLLLEFMEGGSMYDFLHHGPKKSYQYQTARDWAHQIAQGLAYLHDPSVGPIIHRDIKPHNILLSKERLIVKIGDFGNAKPLDNAMTCESGTILYMAPEVYTSRIYTEKCDVYSFGVTVWEMLAMQQPLNWYKNNFPLQMSVINGERPSFGGPMKNCPESMKELIRSCWDKEPSNRPSMKSVIKELNDMINCSGEH